MSAPRSPITTHVLDTARGLPAAGMRVRLDRADPDGWKTLADSVTDADGRVLTLLPPGFALSPARYRLIFETGSYLAAFSAEGAAFYPEVMVQFEVIAAAVPSHFHLPLLLSPFGYSTYRGS